MTALHIGLLYGGATLVALFSGIPIAFALGGVAVLSWRSSCRAPRSIR